MYYSSKPLARKRAQPKPAKPVGRPLLTRSTTRGLIVGPRGGRRDGRPTTSVPICAAAGTCATRPSLRVTRSGPELCRARRRRSGSLGRSRGSGRARRRARYHHNRHDSTGPTPPPFLAASGAQVPQDWEWPADCVKIAASTYNSLNARSRTPRRRPRRIFSKLPRVGPLLAAALGALQQCWFRRSAAVAQVSASGLEHHHVTCRRRAGGTHAAPRRTEVDDRTLQPFLAGALCGARGVAGSRMSAPRTHRWLCSSVRIPRVAQARVR